MDFPEGVTSGDVFLCRESEQRYPRLCTQLAEGLASVGARIHWVEGDNPWVRDWFPVRIPGNGWCQFDYAPPYHANPEFRESIEVQVPSSVGEMANAIPVVLDGGAVVADDRVLLVSSRFVSAVQWAQGLSGIDVESVAPDPEDFTGHLDGLCRLRGSLFLYHDVALDLPGWPGLIRRMEARGYTAVEVPSMLTSDPKSAEGLFLNFIEVAGTVFVPTQGRLRGEKASAQADIVQQLGEALEVSVVAVDASEALSDGGALHCLTWSDQ